MRRIGAGATLRRRSGAAAAVLVAAAIALTGCASASPHPAASDAYGSLPSWLPKDTSEPNSMLVGDVRHPAVTSEGDAVEVHLPGGGSVRVTVVGPEVPGEGLPVQPEDTTCTWTVTMSDATAPVAVRAGDFDTLDHLGTVYRLAAVPGRPAIPRTLLPGRTIRFALRAAMPTGEGLMRYSGGTDSVLANWDFVVEND
ncbi:hypothetical protein [Amnibacterium kyonggiense]|uniref:DUF4352 domain-containing protein n=1 Tax=Amnibacterium kyonggiense TaxID=595671 RepID=A0A4R7FDP8_9MICO|nr:hypothetical protein [Amnibacterium kyonggiense]TDS75099.1 hypothetical protein CLV52_3626 [Amnibacterium kyonggiense]